MVDRAMIKYTNGIKHLPIIIQSFNKATRTVVHRHPGLSYDSYCENGNPSISNLLSLKYSSQHFALTKPYNDRGEMCFFDILKYLKQNDITIFVYNIQLLVNREFYDINISKHNLDIELSPLGRSSRGLSTLTKMFSTDKQHLLCTSLLTKTPVIVSKRKKAEFSEELKSIYPENPKLQAYEIQFFTRFHQAFHLRSTVPYNQIDFNYHIGFYYYVDHVMNAIFTALKTSDAFRHVTLADTQCGLSKLEVVYLKECFLGDDLDIYVWEHLDPECKDLDKIEDLLTDDETDGQRDLNKPGSGSPGVYSVPVRCLIEVKSKPVFQAVLQFHKHVNTSVTQE